MPHEPHETTMNAFNEWGEPKPKPNDAPYIQDRVIEDIESRKQHGIEKYGTALQPFNARNVLKDIYEEDLDRTMYMRQLLEELQQLHNEFGVSSLTDVKDRLTRLHTIETLEATQPGPVSMDIWSDRILSWARRKGWAIPESINEGEAILAKLMLVVSEIGEACEAVRIGDEENFREELADAIIRILHLSAGMSFSMDAEVAQKMARNEDRPYKHGKRL